MSSEGTGTKSKLRLLLLCLYKRLIVVYELVVGGRNIIMTFKNSESVDRRSSQDNEVGAHARVNCQFGLCGV